MEEDDNTVETCARRKPVIRHLVLSGGGPSGIQTLGALYHLETEGFWSMNNIESIYSTSIGGIISILVALKFDWQSIIDYVILRPWHETTNININQVFEVFTKKGIYDVSFIHMFFRPFFNAHDISLHITLQEFYELTKVTTHFYCLDINQFAIEDVSHKTHPDLELLTAAYMSAAVPVLFSPIYIGNKCLIDGGLVLNYPLQYCVRDVGEDKIGEILGCKNSYVKEEFSTIRSESTILEFMMNIITHLVARSNIQLDIVIPHEVACETQVMSLAYMQESLNSREKREEMLQSGVQFAVKFLARVSRDAEG